jgi:hypothetical protein
MVFMDAQLRPAFARPIPRTKPGLAGLSVNRLTLREILLAGLGGAVYFGKAFERFEPAGGGQVCAFFADGTAAARDLLAGADGT